MEFTFKIIEKKDNDLETIIEKGNLTTRFTIGDIKEHLTFTERTLRESKAQLDAEVKQDEMAVEVLPILKDIPNDKWGLVLAYANRQVKRPISEDLVKTSEETIKSYTEQLEYIKETLGLSDEGEVVSNMVEVD